MRVASAERVLRRETVERVRLRYRWSSKGDDRNSGGCGRGTTDGESRRHSGSMPDAVTARQ
jgi:hypothetical protein